MIKKIVKSIAKSKEMPVYTERYHIYYENGDSLSLNVEDLTDKQLKFITTHNATISKVYEIEEIGLKYAECIFE